MNKIILFVSVKSLISVLWKQRVMKKPPRNMDKLIHRDFLGITRTWQSVSNLISKEENSKNMSTMKKFHNEKLDKLYLESIK